MRYAIDEERAAIRKYRQQALWIKDKNVVENLNRIVEDEEVHAEILICLLKSYCTGL